MYKVNAMKGTVVAIAIIAVLFFAQLTYNRVIYSLALVDIKEENYTEAMRTLEGLEGYRDSEDLIAYCEVMDQYDPEDLSTVYNCHRRLEELELDNKNLAAEIASARAEIGALYEHYELLLTGVGE